MQLRGRKQDARSGRRRAGCTAQSQWSRGAALLSGQGSAPPHPPGSPRNTEDLTMCPRARPTYRVHRGRELLDEGGQALGSLPAVLEKARRREATHGTRQRRVREAGREGGGAPRTTGPLRAVPSASGERAPRSQSCLGPDPASQLRDISKSEPQFSGDKWG